MSRGLSAERNQELLRRAVAGATLPCAPFGFERWAAVSEMLGLTPGEASEVCRSLGVDPDEMINVEKST